MQILDGGFGTMLQTLLPDYQGSPDMLCITQPDIVAEIHRRYLRAGADIIETNSFNANALSLAKYNLPASAREIACAAARIARSVADEFADGDKRPLVAGSMGPTGHSLSISPDVDAPEKRTTTFDEMYEAYREQAQGLIEGGADTLLVETVFDTLNAKAALAAIREVSPDIPVMVSGTISDASGRLLSGQTVEAFYASVRHANPVSVGLNCGLGARQLLPYIKRLAAIADTQVSVHPNAGLPNIYGKYDETPATFAEGMTPYLAEGLVDIAGGCCGTTPEHISALKEISKCAKDRGNSSEKPVPLCGLEPVPDAPFINVGERTNVAGSAKFARLIREGNYREAVSVAAAQVESGANIIDICMDDGLIDGPAAMTAFLNHIAGEAATARVPVMIDSSNWDVIVAGLKCVQGKGVVNSISLKEGEEEFLRRARHIRRFGAAVVVMLFDEKGQADTYERKIEVAERSYNLLVNDGFPSTDIIIDPNILAVATGMPEHDRYALDFIEATRWIKRNLPGARVSGGVSNLSFAFRGNNAVRKAMHAAFLYHAIAAGMDMAIVNPQMVQIYDDIDPELLECVEDVILCRRADAAERLSALATRISAESSSEKAPSAPVAEALSAAERIERAMLHGDTSTIVEDSLTAYNEKGDAVAVINDILMPAMKEVGARFGEGRMFLPQVVKSAGVMKQAVAALSPYIPTTGPVGEAGKDIVIATVKGDVHDIGKNIVGVVLTCNGYRVHDLGTMVETERILDAARETNAIAICLSGLISPSLKEMENVVREAESRGFTIPIIVGGATTSAEHTRLRLQPLYSGKVFHSRDAAHNAALLNSL